MLTGWLRGMGMLAAFGLAATSPAQAEGPGAKFKLLPDETYTSPDRQLRIEQYFTDQGEPGYLYRFWSFDQKHRHAFLLNRGESVDVAGYPAGFRFSPDSQWLVRTQKLGAGYLTLFLYRRDGSQFKAATPKPLGELAWDYFFAQPVSRQIHRYRKDRDSLDHLQAGLIKGLEENYASIGQHWPDSRYLVIGLSFDAQGEDQPGPWIEDWRCVYDLKTGTFSIPPDFVENNARTVKMPGSGRP